MPSQTQRFQKIVINAAQKRGELSRLYWAIEWEREPKRYQIALLGGRVPVVPLASDVQDATDAAQVLMYGLQSGKLGRWALCLLDEELLNSLGRAWFVWPETREEKVDESNYISKTLAVGNPARG